MSRFAQEGLDDAVATVGDGVFAGVDLSREPMSLEPGLASEAVNVRFRGNRAETRPALVACGWGVDRALALPADFLLQAATSDADEGTGGETGLAFDVLPVFDRGIRELKFTRNFMRTAGEIGPSVGDSVTASLFTYAPAVHGTYLVTYAGDNSIRVEVDEATWNLVPGTATSGQLVWEGTVGFSQVQGFGTVYGVAVFSDPNGREGVLVAQATRARLLRDGAAADIDAVLCDVKMPGMSGIELYRALERERPVFLDRLVLATGDVASADVATFLADVRCPILEKPFALSVLAEALAAVSVGATPEATPRA